MGVGQAIQTMTRSGIKVARKCRRPQRDSKARTPERPRERARPAELLVLRGICKDGQHDDAGAATDFEAALSARRDFPLAHYQYGLHLAVSDPAGALRHLDRAAEIAGERGVGPAARAKAAELRGAHSM
jgi:hypothetical protein